MYFLSLTPACAAVCCDCAVGFRGGVRQTPAAGVRTYGDIMAEQQLQKERDAVMRQVAKKMEEEKEDKKRAAGGTAEGGGERKKRRWDSAPATGGTEASAASTKLGGATPMLGGETPMLGGETPARADGGATPLVGSSASVAADTTGGSKKRKRINRWNETPDPSATPGVGATPALVGPRPSWERRRCGRGGTRRRWRRRPEGPRPWSA